MGVITIMGVTFAAPSAKCTRFIVRLLPGHDTRLTGSKLTAQLQFPLLCRTVVVVFLASLLQSDSCYENSLL
jgi:hypothetical protein